eukprot:750549-Hanusia_phi.AAC.3
MRSLFKETSVQAAGGEEEKRKGGEENVTSWIAMCSLPRTLSLPRGIEHVWVEQSMRRRERRRKKRRIGKGREGGRTGEVRLGEERSGQVREGGAGQERRGEEGGEERRLRREGGQGTSSLCFLRFDCIPSASHAPLPHSARNSLFCSQLLPSPLLSPVQIGRMGRTGFSTSTTLLALAGPKSPARREESRGGRKKDRVTCLELKNFLLIILKCRDELYQEEKGGGREGGREGGGRTEEENEQRCKRELHSPLHWKTSRSSHLGTA